MPAFQFEEDGLKSGVGGLRYADVVVGTGASPTKGQTIQAHYTGRLTNGRVFDSSYDRGSPLRFKVGVRQVIQGWDDGILRRPSIEGESRREESTHHTTRVRVRRERRWCYTRKRDVTIRRRVGRRLVTAGVAADAERERKKKRKRERERDHCSVTVHPTYFVVVVVVVVVVLLYLVVSFYPAAAALSSRFLCTILTCQILLSFFREHLSKLQKCSKISPYIMPIF